MKRIDLAMPSNKARKISVILFVCMMLLAVTACGQIGDSEDSTVVSQEAKSMVLAINGEKVSVEWEDNESVSALKERASAEPLSIQMSMYGGFEQVGPIGNSLPSNDEQTTTEAGDIVLYSGDQLVVFYGSNSWSYTRLGKVTDKSVAEMAELLGYEDVTITISIE